MILLPVRFILPEKQCDILFCQMERFAGKSGKNFFRLLETGRLHEITDKNYGWLFYDHSGTASFVCRHTSRNAGSTDQGGKKAETAETVSAEHDYGYGITIADSETGQDGIQIMTKDLFVSALVILVFTSLSVGLWIYRSIATPLVKLRKATRNIKDGNLDFVLDVEGTDEFSELCRDFEEMRRRLKESAEEKIILDKENKELISNISHDLKTPITAVKGICGRDYGRSCGYS